MTAPDPHRVAADWSARGYSFGIWEDPAGQAWVDYVHDVDELVMLAEGELELAFGGRVLHPAPGEEILIPAGAAHTVVNVGRSPNRWYYGYRRR